MNKDQSSVKGYNVGILPLLGLLGFWTLLIDLYSQSIPIHHNAGAEEEHPSHNIRYIWYTGTVSQQIFYPGTGINPFDSQTFCPDTESTST